MKNSRLSEHTPRKVLHAILGTFLVFCVYFMEARYGLRPVMFFGVFALLVLIAIDVMRIEFRRNVPLYKDLLKHKEKHRFNALIYSVSAALIVLGAFDFLIAITALLMAVFGDPLASVIGRNFGKMRIPFNKSKTIEGTSGHLIICVIIGMFMLRSLPDVGYGVSMSIGVFMGIVATIVEFFSDKTEDNFTIPLFTAAAGQFLLWVF